MLALAHPVQHAPVDFRPPSASSVSSSSRTSKHPARKSSSSSSSSSVAAASLSSSASTAHAALASNSRSSSREGPSTHHRSSASQPHPNPPRHIHQKPPPPQVEPPHEPVDIHAFPAHDLLRLLASLLTQIAAANDSLTTHPPRADSNPTHSAFDHSQSPVWKTLTTASKAALGNSSSSLSFHARNVPTITLESYLLRILKYCPTTNEVFLSLLVYFDRMSKLASQISGKPFVIDSYNIHRLVIAGVTVASKFFSDVFYTNSRYAKVGGLPQTELNQLELQFLLLNDFRLTISPEELQRYAEQLIVFSESRSPSGISPPPTKMPMGLTAPMQAMGAVDAYGGPLASSHASSAGYPKNGFRTPLVRPRQSSSASFVTTSSEADASDADTSEAGTDVDGETDDEPTIRPAHSSCSSDTLSMYSAASEDTDGDDEDVSSVVGDHRMGSP